MAPIDSAKDVDLFWVWQSRPADAPILVEVSVNNGDPGIQETVVIEDLASSARKLLGISGRIFIFLGLNDLSIYSRLDFLQIVLVKEALDLPNSDQMPRGFYHAF